jgi:hypothetical protein
MAVYNKYNSFSEALVEAINAGTDTWRVILSNTAPAAADVTQADAAELTTSGGYTVNGNACAITSSTQASGVYSLVLVSPTAWTGSGGGFTARYAILWDQTQDKLAGWWDYGSSQAIAAGEAFQFNFGATSFTVT